MSKPINQTNLAIFADRAFAFEIPEHEFDQLRGHIELLVQASNAINVILAKCTVEEFALKHLDMAGHGAAFLTAMAATMLDALAERKG